MIYSTLETAVADIIRLSGFKLLKSPNDFPNAFDFGIESKEGKRIAVEVKAKVSPSIFVGVVTRAGIVLQAGYQEMWLVAPEFPPSVEQFMQGGIVGLLPLASMTVIEFASRLGVQLPGLKWQNLSSLREGSRPDSGTDGQHPMKLDAEEANRQPPQLATLRSQLPTRVSLQDQDPATTDRVLRFGRRHENAVAVMSDIVSFTKIVQASEPDALNEMLTKYYARAHNAVLDQGGVFDKVIGDAVFAVFNYPDGAAKPFESAVRFSAILIKVGRELFDEFFQRNVAVIETGTRIGIATGDIWPINVGSDTVQLSFFGHIINLASRLQHIALVDGVLMCQQTFNRLEEENEPFAASLQATHRLIKKGELSGIATDINTKSISAEKMKAMTEATHNA